MTVGTAAVHVVEGVESEPGALPAHWRPSTVAWALAVLDTWEFEATGWQLLCRAGECLDFEAAAREQIAADGLLVPGVGGTRRAHPLLATATAARGQFLSLVCQLGLAK